MIGHEMVMVMYTRMVTLSVSVSAAPALYLPLRL